MEEHSDAIELDEVPASRLTLILLSPLKLTLSMISMGFRLLRPLAPQLVPAFVCLLLIPALLFFSVSAGWVVWRSVAVGWESPVYLQYGDRISPYAELSLPPLVGKQPYDISLHLTVPATESNFALGNFMASLTLATPSNKTLVSAHRSAIALPPRRGRLPVLSSTPRVVDVDVPLLSSYAPGMENIIAIVELGRKDGWRSLGAGQGRELSVLSASLRGTVKYYGVRGLVTRFPLISSLLSSFAFLVISSFVFALCLLPSIPWRLHTDTPEAKIPEALTPPKQESDYEDLKPPRKRRKSRGSRRFSEVKTETLTSFIPSAASSSSAPLRRRRSQLSSGSVD